MTPGPLSEPLPDPQDTLRLIPLIASLSARRRAAIAAGMTDGTWFDEGQVIPSDRSNRGLSVIAAGGRAMLRVIHGQGLDSEGWRATESTPMSFGGAVLQNEALDVAPDLEVVAQNRLFVFEVDYKRLQTVGKSSAWRHSDAAWKRLVTSMRIAAVLRASPDFQRVSRRDRHRLAGLMTLRWRPEGDVLFGATDLCESMFVLGRGAQAQVTRRPTGGPITTLRTQDYGMSLGVRALDPDARTYREDAVLSRGGLVAELSAASIRRLRASEPSFRYLFEGLVNLWENADLVVDALSRSALVAGIPRATLYDLVQGAWPRLWRVQSHPPQPIGQTVGMIVVLDGELLDQRRDEPEHVAESPHAEAVAALRAGDLAGEEGFVRGLDAANHLCTRVPSRVVFISEHRFYEVLGHDPRFQQNREAVRAALDLTLERRTAFRDRWAPDVNVCLIEPLDRHEMSSDGQYLAAALARSIEDQFEETSAVIHLVAKGGRARLERRRGLNWVISPNAARNPRQALALGIKLLPADVRHAVVVTQPTVDHTEIREVVDHLVFLNRGTTVRWPDAFPKRTPFIYTALLPPIGALRVDRSGPPFPPGTVRLRLDMSPMALEGEDHIGHSLWSGNAASLARWSRAVTDRRVGVALGGGGSWGYAHIAVLHHLREAGVPVDVVSGSSFGAVVGAYFGAFGFEGLKMLQADQQAIGCATTASYVSGVFLQSFFERRMKGARLEELPIPFLPICTDLVSASQSPILSGPVGDGVRASGSLAPLFAPSTQPNATYVDGGLSSNVPATSLQTEGARLLIASDIVPPAAAQPAGPQRPGMLAQFVRDLNPIARLQAAMQGSQTMFFSAGEMSASAAGVHFESRTATTLPFVFTNAERVIEEAVTDPTFWASVQSARTHWDTLRGR